MFLSENTALSDQQEEIGSDTQEQNYYSPGEGYISLHRQIRKHWVYENPEYLKIWIEFLLLASFKNHESIFNEELVNLKRGQFIYGRDSFSKRLGISPYRLRKFISMAKTCNMIRQVRRPKYSIITITNYNPFQKSPAKSPTTRQQPASNPPHHNKGNKGNKVNNKSGLMKYDESFGI